jgi:TPR repeat protein
MDIDLSGQELCDVEVEAAPCGEPVDAEGCFARGIYFSSGREGTLDLIAAHKWFNIAASRGHAEAVEMRREVAGQMADGEIGQAQRAARDWLKAHPLPHVQQPMRAAA